MAPPKRKKFSPFLRYLRWRHRVVASFIGMLCLGIVAFLHQILGGENLRESWLLLEENLPELLGATIRLVFFGGLGVVFVRFGWRALFPKKGLQEYPPPKPIFREVDSSDSSPQGGAPERIATLREHQEALFNALRKARSNVVIVSPTISARAIEHDDLEREIQKARRRGVVVRVFTDNLLDLERETGKPRPNAAEGRERLVRAGAELYVTERIHNKSLTIDGTELIEGSFNWLSAVRVENASHQKHEVSWGVCGEDAKAKIGELKSELQNRVLAQLR